VVGYWRGYLPAARCKLFAYDRVDVTATPSSLAPVKSRMVSLSATGLPRLSWKKGCQTVEVPGSFCEHFHHAGIVNISRPKTNIFGNKNAQVKTMWQNFLIL